MKRTDEPMRIVNARDDLMCLGPMVDVRAATEQERRYFYAARGLVDQYAAFEGLSARAGRSVTQKVMGRSVAAVSSRAERSPLLTLVACLMLAYIVLIVFVMTVPR